MNSYLRKAMTDPHAASSSAAPRHESPWTLAPDRTPAAAIADAIRQLDGLERVVVSLYCMEGLRLPQIAQVLDLDEVEVTRLYTRAMAYIRTAGLLAQRHAA